MTTIYVLRGLTYDETGPDSELFTPSLHSTLELAQAATRCYVDETPLAGEALEWEEAADKAEWGAEIRDITFMISEAEVDAA